MVSTNCHRYIYLWVKFNTTGQIFCQCQAQFNMTEQLTFIQHWELIVLFFFIAALYASVGFGGGSSYLAILALFGVNFLLTRSTALFCNITVVTSGVYIFYKNGHLDLRKALPLTIASVPLAFVGGYLPIQEKYFFILLGTALLIAAVLTWVQPPFKSLAPPIPAAPEISKSNFRNLVIGGSIGLLSGIVGIGGGIFLAPVLYLTRWAEPKTVAATSSLFILLNSISGLAGQMAKPGFIMDWQFVLPLMLSVFLGGQLGARFAANRLPSLWVRRATALLIFYVSIRLVLKYL